MEEVVESHHSPARAPTSTHIRVSTRRGEVRILGVLGWGGGEACWMRDGGARGEGGAGATGSAYVQSKPSGAP